MTTLLVAEHDNKSLKDATAKALTASVALGQPVHVLVAGKNCKAAADAAAQFAGVEAMAVDPEEPNGANCLRVGDYLILPAGNPRTAARLRDRGFQVLEIDVSELQKAEAGVTCMSLIES